MPVIDVLKPLEKGELSKLLPASYAINKSNISLLLEIIEEQQNELIKAISDTEKVNDFDFIFGKSIDYLGADYNEDRNGETDDDYLLRIKMRNLASGSLGDENSIITGTAGYFHYPNARVQITTVDTRKIEVVYPAEINEEKFIFCLENLKAAGIRYMTTKDIFWEDLTYAELAESAYEDLAKLRYQRRYPPAWEDYRYNELANNTYFELNQLNYTRRDNENE